MRLYQVFNLGALQLHPYDYFADLLAESRYGVKQGFFPTPMPVCQMMAAMLMEGQRLPDGNGLRSVLRHRALPAGRQQLQLAPLRPGHRRNADQGDAGEWLLLRALATETYRPGWTGRNVDPARSGEVSERLTQAANTPAAADYLSDTEHDAAQQWQYEPIKKRRLKKEDTTREDEMTMQGLLF